MKQYKWIDKRFKNILSILGNLIFIVACISFFTNKNILGSILVFIFILTKYISYDKDEDYIEVIEKAINKNIENNILNLVSPVALIKESGDIFWCNNEFKKFSQDNIIGVNIVSIARGLNLSKLLECDKDLNQKIKITDSLYKIYASKIPKQESHEEFYIVYLNDISQQKNLDKTKESIVLIEVDNLQEVLENTSEGDRPMLRADVEKTINLYAQKLKAMITKYDSNKYIMSVQDKYIDEEIEVKFPILDDISNIDRGNKIEVTLSIGIGRGGSSPLENNNFAVIAKELALGRGGDQVVIKSNDKIKFFGGNSREIEKRTRVRARVISHALKELIYESSNVFIMGHKNPDMDCFGASMGLAAVVKQLGKKCNIILNNDTSAIDYYKAKLKKDSKYDDLFISCKKAYEDMTDNTLLMILDVHNKSYILDNSIAEKSQRKVIVDHHRRSPDIVEGAILNYIEVYASSTSELVTEMIQYMVDKPNINRLEAEGLLAGIFMDTKAFSFKTGVRTFDAASFLRGLGADPIEVKRMFMDDINDYLIVAETIKSAEFKGNLAIAKVPEEAKKSYIAAKAADELLNINGISVCFVLVRINDDIIISARSVGDINVQIILEDIGGGGHMNIAGAQLKNKTVEEAIEILKESIDKYLRVGE